MSSHNDTKVVKLVNPVGYGSDSAGMGSMPSPLPISNSMEGGRPPVSNSIANSMEGGGRPPVTSRRLSVSSGSSSRSSSSAGSKSRRPRSRSGSSRKSSRSESSKSASSDEEDIRGKEEESEEESSDSEDEYGGEDDEGGEEDAISMTSTEILENDPLFFVLSRIFVTHDKKKNIADLLQEVVDLLKEQRDHRLHREQRMHPRMA